MIHIPPPPPVVWGFVIGTVMVAFGYFATSHLLFEQSHHFVWG